MERLTNRKIKNYIASLKKDFTVTDISGLMVMFRVGIKGNTRAFFYYRFSIDGKQKRFKIGSFPAFSLEEARTELFKLKQLKERGLLIDPDDFHKNRGKYTTGNFDLEDRVELKTIEELYNEFITFKKKRGVTDVTIESNYHRIVWPRLKKFKNTDIRNITVRWVDKNIFTDDKHLSSVNKTGSFLKAMMGFAEAKGYIHANTLTSLNMVAPRKKKEHRPSFEYETLKEEISLLFEKMIYKLPKEYAGGIFLLFHTLLRANEMLGLGFDDLKEESEYHYAIIKTKTWKQFKIPFTKQAMCIIKWFENNPQGLNKKIISKQGCALVLDQLRYALYSLGYKGKLSIHGIRSCGRQYMAQQSNIKESTAELCLAHTVGDQTEQAYNRGSYIAQRFEAMKQWSDYLESCLPKGLTFKKIFGIET